MSSARWNTSMPIMRGADCAVVPNTHWWCPSWPTFHRGLLQRCSMIFAEWRNNVVRSLTSQCSRPWTRRRWRTFWLKRKLKSLWRNHQEGPYGTLFQILRLLWWWMAKDREGRKNAADWHLQLSDRRVWWPINKTTKWMADFTAMGFAATEIQLYMNTENDINIKTSAVSWNIRYNSADDETSDKRILWCYTTLHKWKNVKSWKKQRLAILRRTNHGIRWSKVENIQKKRFERSFLRRIKS